MSLPISGICSASVVFKFGTVNLVTIQPIRRTAVPTIAAINPHFLLAIMPIPAAIMIKVPSNIAKPEIATAFACSENSAVSSLPKPD